MALQKPLKRTVRQLTNGTYSNDGHWQYLLHPKFANDPQHGDYGQSLPAFQ